MNMESVVRDVNSIESNERLVYETVLGHVLRENQRVIIRVIDAEGEPDEATRRAALGRGAEIARQGRGAAEAQGIATETADQAIDQAIRKARRSIQ